jgi:hypothetical protein
MNKKNSNKEAKLFEYRIKYISRNSRGHNYHYYLAENAKKAIEYQLEMMDHKHWEIELVSLERKTFSPYASRHRWVDESDILTQITQEQ